MSTGIYWTGASSLLVLATPFASSNYFEKLARPWEGSAGDISSRLVGVSSFLLYSYFWCGGTARFTTLYSSIHVSGNLQILIDLSLEQVISCYFSSCHSSCVTGPVCACITYIGDCCFRSQTVTTPDSSAVIISRLGFSLHATNRTPSLPMNETNSFASLSLPGWPRSYTVIRPSLHPATRKFSAELTASPLISVLVSTASVFSFFKGEPALL